MVLPSVVLCPVNTIHFCEVKTLSDSCQIHFALCMWFPYLIISTYVQCMWEECEGLLYIYSLILKLGKLGLDMHLRLHEQLYVQFQFYTAHYIVDYSSMLSTADAHTNCIFFHFH